MPFAESRSSDCPPKSDLRFLRHVMEQARRAAERRPIEQPAGIAPAESFVFLPVPG
jgi:hypothetical protein